MSLLTDPVVSQLQFLPFEQLTWENFEQLCLKLAQEKSSINDCERYGQQGSAQEGIDIFRILDDGKYDTYQCKRYSAFKVSDLDKVIETFKKGSFFQQSKSFTICTSCELNTPKLQDAFNRYKVELRADNIELIKWDKIQLSHILKDYPKLVLEFFREFWLKDFLGIDKVSLLYNMSDDEINEKLKLASCDLSVINNIFKNLPDSHIDRKETTELLEWILRPLDKKESNICVLAGNAGTGKTVILKDLFDLLNKESIPVLGLKADKTILDINNIGKSILGFDSALETVFNMLLSANKTVVVLIDQIDALSQSLSTNRELINTYTSLINRLSLINGVRIIISCRIFDLNRDAELKQYTNRKEIRLSLLSENEVEVVLKQLTHNDINSFPRVLIELLKTPLHLDLFCRIYNESTKLSEIKTNQDLYLELWKIKIQDAYLKTGIQYSTLKELLYKLSETIYQKQGNLSVSSLPFDSYFREIEYLKSEYLIVDYQNSERIQFFHQSFYDYTYSRYFVENKGGDVYQYLLHEHQGLFIRSLIKQVLSYLRLYNSTEYNQQINKILFSDKIRYHIKLLLVEQLAFEDKPKPNEIDIIQQLSKRNQLLTIAFFNSSPQPEWFNCFEKKNRDFLFQLLNSPHEQIRKSVASSIVFSGDLDFNAAHNLLKGINDYEERNIHIRWMLFRSKDFSSTVIQDIYSDLDKNFIQYDRERYHILRNAVNTAPEFTIKEARKLFIGNLLPDWKKKKKRELNFESDEREFYHLCEDLYKVHPIKSYYFFREIIFSLADCSVYETYHDYKRIKIDYAFIDLNPNTYEHHKLIDWVVEILKTATIELTISELAYYLSSNLTIHINIALQAMSNNVVTFKDTILKVLIDKDLAEDCIENKDLRYWYRELLNKSYSFYSQEQKDRLNEFTLSFMTDEDTFPNLDRHKNYQKSLYPRLGYSQWLLLNSIPSGEVSKQKNLILKLNELNRKFQEWECTNKKPTHNIGMAHACGGLVSKDKYKKFGLKQWYNSFIEFNEDKHYENHWYLSLDEHANAFKEVVSENANSYYPFVSSIISEQDIHIRYKIKGLEGLAIANYDILKIRELYETLLQQEIPKYYIYSFIRFGENFIDNSSVDSGLIDFWKKIAFGSFEKRKVHYYAGNNEIRNDELFTQGYGTPNAEALTLLVGLSFLENYKDEIYQYLLDICHQLPIQLRLVVLSELKQESLFETEQLLELFLKYSNEVTSEIYQVAANLLNFLFYKYFEQLIPFVEQTIELEQSAKYLARYLLYGWLYGYDRSKDLLLELHDKQPDSIKETIFEVCEYYNEIEYKDKCHYILELYINNTHKDIRQAFSSGFFSLPPDCFQELRPIINQYINYIDEDRLHSLYRYLISVAKDYPKDCIEIQHQIYDKKKFKYDSELKEPVELFTLCYNTIKEFNSNNETIEYTMDIFDKLLQKSNFRVEIDKILKEVDCV
jgi:hypothetical protein